VPVKQVVVCLRHEGPVSTAGSHDRVDHLGCDLQEVVRETAKVWDLTIIGTDAEAEIRGEEEEPSES
jgi:hypothetical protein